MKKKCPLLLSDVIKITLYRQIAWDTLDVQHISLIECILSCGEPMSIVGIPSLADMIGPMVDPQGESFLTTKS